MNYCYDVGMSTRVHFLSWFTYLHRRWRLHLRNGRPRLKCINIARPQIVRRILPCHKLQREQLEIS